MFRFDVRTQGVNETIARLNAIKSGLGDKCIARSLNDAAAKAKTAVTRNITSEYNIKASDIRDFITLTRANAAGVRFTAIVSGNPYGRRRRALNVTRFLDQRATLREWRKGFGMKRPDLVVRIKRGGGARPIPHAFILNVAGNPVVERVGTGRGQLKGVLTIGVPQMFNARKVQIPVQRAVPLWFNESFGRNVRYFLSTVR